MKIVSVIARYLLGLMFTIFGLNGFFNFIHQPPPTNPLAIQFFVAIGTSHFAAFFFAVQLIGGLLFAFRLLCAARAHGACGGAVQQVLAFPPHAVAGHRSGAGSVRVVGARLPAVPQ